MFYEIEFPLGNLDVEAVEDSLRELGSCSITFVDRGDEPILEPKPGEMRLWGDTLVRALFESADGAEHGGALERIHALASRLGRLITDTARVTSVQNS